MSEKLVGYRFSPTVQEVLHVINITKAPVELQDVDWEDAETRKTLSPKSPTGTFPFLETSEGVLSESRAIENYLAMKHKPELLGESDFEKAQVKQWSDFAIFEIGFCAKEVVYPIFGWRNYCKESYDKANNRVKEHMKLLDAQLKDKEFVMGGKLTMADVNLFRELKYFFQLVFPKGLRDKLFPNATKWFQKMAETEEAKKAYGKILLCNQPMKPFAKEEKKEEKKPEKKQEKKQEKKPEEEEEKKKPPKKENPLDLLPPSRLELEVFKRAFLNNKDKEDAMNKFWEIYDPEGYSLWWVEYQNLPTECKVLFRTSNSKGMFLQKCDPLRRYAFAVHGVYGVEDDYKIRGLWMFRGKEIPQEMKDNDLYEYLTFRQIDINNPDDKKLVHDYWTKLNETDEVEGRKCADVEYFN